MDRVQLIQTLNSYDTQFEEERAFIPRFKSLLTNFPTCYQRSLLTGHMTASAWIIDKKYKSALLVHHKKLKRWLQPGGHADGEENIIEVATKEALEETGLKSLRLKSHTIFDIDIHLIPAHKQIKSHFHYDIRFLFVADESEDYVVSDESSELAWIPLNEIHNFTGSEISIHRMVLKTKLFLNNSLNPYI